MKVGSIGQSAIKIGNWKTYKVGKQSVLDPGMIVIRQNHLFDICDFCGR
jgi:hypothetical protein